jgi:hypothetical protein
LIHLVTVRTILRVLLVFTALAAALVLTARAFLGPFELGLSVRSPINAESIFAAAAILLLILRPGSGRSTRYRNLPELYLVPGLAATLLVAHWPSIFVGFLADDYAHILAGHKADLATVAHWFTVPAADNYFFRPVGMSTYWLDAQWAGFSAIRWHAGTVALHTVNSLLVLALARRLGLAPIWAAFAAALFGLHGSRPEVVTWTAAHFDLLATLFVLIAVHAFLSWSAKPNALWLVLLMLVSAGGYFSKESAFILPLLLLLCAWYQRHLRFREGKAILVVAILAVVAFTIRWSILGGIGGYVDPSGRPGVLAFNVTLAAKALLLRQWAILFFPINWTDPLSLALQLAIPLAASAALAILWFGRRDRLVVFGLAFTLLAALPVYHLLLIGPDLEKSRVLYLGSIGFAIFLAAAARSIPAKWPMAAMSVILLFQALALRHNLSTWDRVARLHERACDVIALAAAASSGDVIAVGMPNTWDGIYMLRTGLQACVEVRHGIFGWRIHPVPALSDAGRFPGLPVYRWDNATAAVVRIR